MLVWFEPAGALVNNAPAEILVGAPVNTAPPEIVVVGACVAITALPTGDPEDPMTGGVGEGVDAAPLRPDTRNVIIAADTEVSVIMVSMDTDMSEMTMPVV